MRRGIFVLALLMLGCVSAPELDGRPCGPGDVCPDELVCHTDRTCRRTCDFAAPCPLPDQSCIRGICLGTDKRDGGTGGTIGGPCEGAERRCTIPPADECLDEVFRTYGQVGVCDSATMMCIYTAIEEPCPECSANCLGPCATLTCDDLAGGCRTNGRCAPDGTGGVRCAYDLADEGSTCSKASGGAGVCASGVCSDCSNEQDCATSNMCISGVRCVSGTCTGGQATVCDSPPDACHEATGTCEPATGECAYAPILDGSACDDGNACTMDEICTAGVCSGGAAIQCNDDNECTTDGCLPASGCDFRPNTNPCDDRDLCTSNDMCAGGVCGGTAVVCANDECVARECNGTSTCNEMPLPTTEACTSDGNPCTRDFCDGGGQCAHTALANGSSCGGAASLRCCGATCVDISSNRSHCGGCGTACTEAFACESVAVTTQCTPSPANTTGRCRCLADNSHCPLGQVCRTFTPYIDRCAPPGVANCAPGTSFTDVTGCPNFCGY